MDEDTPTINVYATTSKVQIELYVPSGAVIAIDEV